MCLLTYSAEDSIQRYILPCNVTDVKYTGLRVRNRKMSEVGGIIVFVFKCGEQRGLISLCEANNEYVSIEL